MSLDISGKEGRGARTVVPVAEQIENAYAGIKLNKAHYYIMAMLLLGVFFDSLEQNAVGVTGPVLRKYWNLNTGDIGFLNTVTFTMVALGRLLTGAIADQFGRRTLLIANLVNFAFGSLLCLRTSLCTSCSGDLLPALGSRDAPFLGSAGQDR